MSKKQPNSTDLPRRERQVLDILYAKTAASVADVQAQLNDKPTYSATRMLLQRLQKKGLATYRMEGPKYIYSPALPKTSASSAAWHRLVKTFFGGSIANAFSALLGSSAEALSDEELDELEALVAQAKAKRK